MEGPAASPAPTKQSSGLLRAERKSSRSAGQGGSKKSSRDSKDERGRHDLLLRFFNSEFFDEWIAVTYLHRNTSDGVNDYLCNKLYTLPEDGIDRYLSQLTHIAAQRPGSTLDKFLIDVCANSLRVAIKCYWLLASICADKPPEHPVWRLKGQCEAAAVSGSWDPPFRNFVLGAPPGRGPDDPARRHRARKDLSSDLTGTETLSARAASPTTPDQNGAGLRRSDSSSQLSVTGSVIVHESDGSTFSHERHSGADGPASPPAHVSGRYSRIRVELGDGEGVTGLLERSRGAAGAVPVRASLDSAGASPPTSPRLRETTFGSTLDLVEALSEASAGLCDVPQAQRPEALRMALSAIDSEVQAASRRSVAIVFPMFCADERIVRIPADAAVLLSSRDKAPFLLTLEVLTKYPERRSPGCSANVLGGGPARGGASAHVPRGSRGSAVPGTAQRAGLGSTGDATAGELARLSGYTAEDTGRRLSAASSIGGLVRPGSGTNLSQLSQHHAGGAPSPGMMANLPGPGFLARQASPHGHSRQPSHAGSSQSVTPRHLGAGTPATQLGATSTGNSARKGGMPASASLQGLAEEHGKAVEQGGAVRAPGGATAGTVARVATAAAALRGEAPAVQVRIRVVEELDSEDEDDDQGDAGAGGGGHAHAGSATFGNRLLCAIGLCKTPLQLARGRDRRRARKLVVVDLDVNGGLDLTVAASPYKGRPGRGTSGSHRRVPSQEALTMMQQMQKVDQLPPPRSFQVPFAASPLSPTPEGHEAGGGAATPPQPAPSAAPPQPRDRNRCRAAARQRRAARATAAAARDAGANAHAPRHARSASAGTGLREQARERLMHEAAEVFGEPWSERLERLRAESPLGHLPEWSVRQVIVKVGDDCRQELLAVQLLRQFQDVFAEAGLPLWLRPYQVLVTSSHSALIEMVPDSLSVHTIKSRCPPGTSLSDWFFARWERGTPECEAAQRRFAESIAAYSLVTYLLQVKDRHNGNILIDAEGHVVHIDFGFMLSNSPGSVNFESSPFKLTREFLEVMDSNAEGRASELFDYFKVLCIQGFLAVRRHSDRILGLVDMMKDSGCPCFKGGARALQALKRRLQPGGTDEQCVQMVLGLISDSVDAWRTRQYDHYQRVLNGIL
ncbi:unnamed protein product [Pedinophyceae sp. YPF-701]|nr:unnamed protein product [Pedinophyceae sp. YPF-701]